MCWVVTVRNDLFLVKDKELKHFLCLKCRNFALKKESHSSSAFLLLTIAYFHGDLDHE